MAHLYTVNGEVRPPGLLRSTSAMGLTPQTPVTFQASDKTRKGGDAYRNISLPYSNHKA